jgi:signal transduction histidine kinase/CheY-like chemotaxis protein
VVSLGTRTGDRPFSASELALLELLAKQASHAVENCNLMAQLQQEISQREHSRAEKEAADDANRAKSAFLASMSHELRTPLNAILGYSEMLRETAQEIRADEMIQDLDRIHTAGRHLLILINSVLDLAKIEGGRMELYLETTSVEKLVENVVGIVQPLVAKNGNSLDYSIAPSLGFIETDSTKLRQCLFNLLSNAAKFTSKGKIHLRVTQEFEGQTNWIHFRVEDTGIGISPDQMPKLFQLFSQANAAISSTYGGTGLGLALSRRFCQLMGGDITVETEAGRGSAFTIKLPAKVDVPQQPESSQVSESSGCPAREGSSLVLVIDDDKTVHDLLTRWLTRDGFRVISACEGGEGLAKAKEFHPDVITLDVMMPGNDGWKTLAAFKADPEVAVIPIVMLTIVDDKHAGFCLGATDYLVKPVDQSQLISALAKFRTSAQERRALIIDDDEGSRQRLQRMLAILGWKTMQASNGQEGLSRLAQFRPDLILLDLIMPEMDGFEFVEAMRKNAQWGDIPVLVITAKDLSERERQWLETKVHSIMDKTNYGREEFLREITSRVRTLVPSRVS